MRPATRYIHEFQEPDPASGAVTSRSQSSYAS